MFYISSGTAFIDCFRFSTIQYLILREEVNWRWRHYNLYFLDIGPHYMLALICFAKDDSFLIQLPRVLGWVIYLNVSYDPGLLLLFCCPISHMAPAPGDF